MSLEERIDRLAEMGQQMLKDPHMEEITHKAYAANPWFTIENVKKSIEVICTEYLNRAKLQEWTRQYNIHTTPQSKAIGLVMAGNIPAVGFHDLLSVWICGYKALIKFSTKDQNIMSWITGWMNRLDTREDNYITEVELLTNFDAVIATGGDNTSRYFEYYFRHVPHIIRKNRNGIAILHGSENYDDLYLLGHDVFSYFGLGCRNVSRLWAPESFEVDALLEPWNNFDHVMDHTKYKNNYDYNLALFLLNKEKFIQHPNILLKEDDQIASRIACINISRYQSLQEVMDDINHNADKIQCIISAQSMGGVSVISPGQSQNPSLWDYADGVDTMQFLTTL
ncbi:MAG TPA: acyl-CoA reductase [Saprospiraceae bacterium]|nr:acyl-CoA reductase [Saprospiraceae bacterium]